MCHSDVPAGTLAPPVRTREVSVPCADGRGMPAFLALPAAAPPAPAPAVLVISDANGRSGFYEHLACLLAEAGYAACAPDYFHRVPPLADLEPETRRGRRKQTLDEQAVLADLRATLAWLRSLPEAGGPVGVLGFCMGGTHSLDLAADNPPPAASVTFYGYLRGEPGKALVPPPRPLDLAEAMRAPLLAFWGDRDPGHDPQALREFEERLDAAGRAHEVRVYPAIGHGFLREFLDEPGTTGHAVAADAWVRTLAFFKEHLRPIGLDAVFGSLAAGFLTVFSWPTFGYMLAGIGIGFAVGILPGLGGPVTLALMLPFTFNLQPVDAFAFLLGMAAVTSTTGDITSVLFGVPGEPTSAATVLDGHAMAKKGEAGRALGAALMSSLVGAIFGAFVLALSVPIIRPIVLLFASPEFFMLTILGITFVASLSGGQIIKGLIMGAFGVMLATVGLDPQSGVQRYTLGQLTLWDGVGLVPVAVGLFAFPEIVDMAIRGTSIAERKLGKIGGVMEGIKDTFRHIGVTLRCSAIGTFIGVVPGLGAGVAQWMSYAHAVQSAKDKTRFGKGAVEGVLGPGAANNSGLGGSLVPTIGFGVPGGLLMAILLGAFLIHGIQPGPRMLDPNRELPLTMSFVWVIVVSNIITVGICLLFLEQIARITYLRVGLLIPSIVLLVYVGAFAEKNAMSDLLTTIVFGFLGLVLVYLGWPRPPLVLGLVLGRLAENYLFLTTARYSPDEWLSRPIVIILIIASIGAIFFPVINRRLAARRGRPLIPEGLRDEDA